MFFFILIPNIVLANKTYKPYCISINGILVTKDVASKIFDDAKNNNLKIYDSNNNAVTTVTENLDVVIEKSDLMDKIHELYYSGKSYYTNPGIEQKEAEDGKIEIYIKKGEKAEIVSLIIH